MAEFTTEQAAELAKQGSTIFSGLKDIWYGVKKDVPKPTTPTPPVPADNNNNKPPKPGMSNLTKGILIGTGVIFLTGIVWVTVVLVKKKK